MFKKCCYFHWIVKIHYQINRNLVFTMYYCRKKIFQSKMSPYSVTVGFTCNYVLFPSCLTFYFTCLICMQAVEQKKTKSRQKRKGKSAHLQCALFLFMKALPGTMEINYLLTMWNRILFTRLRFPMLFQMRFFTASSFVSHSIIVSISQNKSVSRKELKKTNE